MAAASVWVDADACPNVRAASAIRPITFAEFSRCVILWTQCVPAATSAGVRRRSRSRIAMHSRGISTRGSRDGHALKWRTKFLNP